MPTATMKTMKTSMFATILGAADGSTPGQRRGPRIREDPKERERDDAQHQKNYEEPNPHAQPEHPGDRAQVATGEEGRQDATPLMLDREEDERGGHRARDARDAEHRPERARRREDAPEDRVQNPPDETGQDPAAERQRRKHVRHQDRAPTHEPGTGARCRVGALEWTRPARAPGDADRDQRGEAEDEVDDLPSGDLRLELGRRVVDEPEVEPRQQRAEEVAEELRPGQFRG